LFLHNESDCCHRIHVSKSHFTAKPNADRGARLLGIVINCGGGQDDDGYIGGRYWADPGAFNGGFKGFCNILVTAAFSFAGTELVGLAAAETHNPSKSLPTAIKQVFWRIALVSRVSFRSLIRLLICKVLYRLNHHRRFTGSIQQLRAHRSKQC